MEAVLEVTSWQKRIGHQRDWVWRGWQTRYSFLHPRDRQRASQPPIILLHGFGASIEHWRQNIAILSQSSSVYALDLLGFGGSKKADTQYSVYLWTRQVYDFWRTFINQPVILVGNSIGSLVCLTAAYNYPEMVAGISILSLPDVAIRQEAIPKPLQPIVMSIEGLFASPWLLKGLFRFLRQPSVIRRWAGVAYVKQTAVNEELVEILTRPAHDPGADTTFYRLFDAVRSPNFAPPAKMVLPSLEIPVLLIWGLQDRMVPPALAEVFAKLNPHIELVELAGVGHCPQDECPEQFNPILQNWIKTRFGYQVS